MEYMFSIFSFSRKWCLKRHHVLEWNYASYHSHSLFPEYHLKHHQYLYFHCHPKILIDWERCCLHQRSTCLYDYGPGSVLSLTECTLFGLYPWLNFVLSDYYFELRFCYDEWFFYWLFFFSRFVPGLSGCGCHWLWNHLLWLCLFLER